MLHPQVRPILADAEASVPVGAPGFDLVESRRSMSADAPRPTAAGARLQGVRDLSVGDVPCRLYPAASGARLVLHLHGGGWALGDLASHDAICREVAVRSGWSVLAVDYRLAPEHPFPSAPDDVQAVMAALPDADLDVDAGRVAVLGDSAGGNLAAVTALRCRDAGAPLAAQILVYPCLDATGSQPSYAAENGGLTAAEMDWYWSTYAPDEELRASRDVSPFVADIADLAGLPPTLLITAEHDPLRDEGEVYAGRLAQAGVDVVGVRYLGMVHGFWRRPTEIDVALDAVDQVAALLRSRAL